MGVRYKLPFTVVNLRIHGWLTRALVQQQIEDDHYSIIPILLPWQVGYVVELLYY
jgi:hypothetical protein